MLHNHHMAKGGEPETQTLLPETNTADKQMMPQTICNLCLGHLSHMGNNRLLLLLQGGGGGAYTVQRSAAGARSPQLTSTLPPEEGAADTLKYPALARNRSALDPE